MCKTKISYSAFVAMVALCGASMFVGCGDDNSASVIDVQTEVSSSSVEGKNAESSSSVKNSSSSTEKKKSSSSSKEQIKSSSSSKEETHEENSSSEPESSSSSSSCSSSSSSSSSSYVDPYEEPFDFDWTMSRDAFLNPEIEYDTIVDGRDGQVYKTVKIGSQTWMAQNLNYADSAETPSLVGRNWCYDDKNASCDVLGRLYTWAAAIDSVKLANDEKNPQQCGYYTTCKLPAVVQGICPEGWHLPSADEWKQLIVFVDDSLESYNWQNSAGRKLMSQAGWVCEDRGPFLCEEDWMGLDAVGFSAQPSGYHSFGDFFRKAGVSTGMWSSTEFFKEEASFASVGAHGGPSAQVLSTGKRFGLSVRCVKN
jgi:uncharacterized protein (TIGR02145 family)